MAMCSSFEQFEVKVKGSKGSTYAVTHGRVADGSRDFSCTCAAFKFRHGYCKHINDVRNQACLWHQQFHGGKAIDGNCPNCGEKVIGIMCAV